MRVTFELHSDCVSLVENKEIQDILIQTLAGGLDSLQTLRRVPEWIVMDDRLCTTLASMIAAFAIERSVVAEAPVVTKVRAPEKRDEDPDDDDLPEIELDKELPLSFDDYPHEINDEELLIDEEEFFKYANREDHQLLLVYFYQVRQYPLFTREQEFAHFQVLDGYHGEIMLRILSSEATMQFLARGDDREENQDDDEEAGAEKPPSGWLYIHEAHHSLIALLNSKTRDAGVDYEVLRKEADSWFPVYEKACLLKQEITNHNLRLVISVAKRYAYSSMSFMDRIQEGNIGLLRAIDTFERSRGLKFSTYAHWGVRQAIWRAIHQKDHTIRIPDHVYPEIKALEDAAWELRDADGAFPSDEQLAAHLGWTLEAVQRVQNARTLRYTGSLDDLLDPDAVRPNSFLAITQDDTAPPPETSLIRDEIPDDLQRVLDTLTPKEAHILDLRHGLHGEQPHTLEQIRQIFGVSRERIRQIEARALTRLRRRLKTGYVSPPKKN